MKNNTMKNTIITIASVATLAVSANAQTSTFDSNLDGWTAIPNSSDVSFSDGFNGSDGLMAFGGNNANAGGQASRALSVAASYNVSFEYGQWFTGDSVGVFEVLDGASVIFSSGNLVDPTKTTTTADDTTDQLFTGSFAGTGNPLTARFTNTTASGFTDWHVDNVSITAVPEPSSTALLGLGALGLLVRRKR